MVGKKIYFFLFLFVLLCAVHGKEKIKLSLTDGNILFTEQVKVEENGDLVFLHPLTNSSMRLAGHLLLKMDHPKPLLLKKADTLFQQKKYRESALLYKQGAEKFCRIVPWENYAKFHEGKSLLLAGRKKEGYTKLAALIPHDLKITENTQKELISALFLLSAFYAENREEEKAYPLLDKLISSPLDEESAAALLKKGEYLLQEEKWEKAASFLALFPILFPADKRKKEAEKLFRKAWDKSRDLQGKKYPFMQK